jgi:NitT/TauT family transport system permease protein
MNQSQASAGAPPGAVSPQAAFAARAARKRSFWDGRSGTLLLQLAVGILILVAWELASRAGLINPILLGRPSLIGQRIFEMLAGDEVYSRTIYDHLWTTLQVVLLGYVLGSAGGIALAFVLGRSRFLSKVFEPLILSIASIPKIAIAPLFIIVLGIGITSKLAIVFIEVFFMVFFSALRGVVEVNEDYVHIARIMGASRWKVMRRIIIPAALPDIMHGLRMGVPFAMIGAILGEFISSNQGLGWLILYSSSSLDPNSLWAALAFLVVTTWLLGVILGMIEARVLAWQPQRRESGMRV